MREMLCTVAVAVMLCGCSEIAPEKTYSDEEMNKLVEDFLNPDEDIFSEAAAKLKNAPGQCIPVLTKIMFENPVVLNRRRAVMTLCMTEDERAIAPLIKALKELDWEVTIWAARGLGEFGAEEAIEPLIDKLASENDGERQFSYVALKRITGEDFDKDYNAWKKWHDSREK
jgi:HEAT repeat protein